jgi:hypothetical protein
MGRAADPVGMAVLSLNRINPVPFKNLKALFGIVTNTLVSLAVTLVLSIIGIPFRFAKLNG